MYNCMILVEFCPVIYYITVQHSEWHITDT